MSMANDLLTSFNAASRAYGHVVFNEKTQEFERAGKRHAIATFFGLPDARAKNNLTLLKIKEALRFETAEGGRFSGCGEVTDGLFRSVDGDRRIRSSTVNAIIKAFGNTRIAAEGSADKTESADCVNPHEQVLRRGSGCGIEKAATLLAEQLKSEKEYMIVLDSPRFTDVSFYSRSGQGSSARVKEVEQHCKDIKDILIMYCGEGNGEQVAMAMYAMAQAAKQVILPYTIQNAIDGLPRSFCPVYTVSTAMSGDLELKISNTRESDIALDWTITIHPDGTHTATDPVVEACHH